MLTKVMGKSPQAQPTPTETESKSTILTPDEVEELEAADKKLEPDPAEDLILSSGIPSLPGSAITLIVQASEEYYSAGDKSDEALTLISLAQSRLNRWSAWIKARGSQGCFAGTDFPSAAILR